ncbi:MAG: hypothetical protein ABI543_09810 [Ignavibacteria bacterium]
MAEIKSKEYSFMENQENEQEVLYNSEESAVNEIEIDELEDAEEKKIYLWLFLGLVTIILISYLVI